MSLPQHVDAQLRFDQQVENSREYVLPFIEEKYPLHSGMRVMEIGCGEGGVLMPFLQRGCECVGVDLEPERIALAEKFLSYFRQQRQLQLIAKNIYEVDFLGEFKNSFDLIILKDAIEHIPDQQKLIAYLKKLLKPSGQVFFGFPPWQMPFGGHQQICRTKAMSSVPFTHLLPTPLYKGLLKLFKENDSTIKELLEIKDTGISIERFERIVRKEGYQIINKRHYLINPIYLYKFGLQPQRQYGVIRVIPFARNFFTTCVYYMIRQ